MTMGKANYKDGPAHLQCRVSYLYQAATYFARLSSAQYPESEKANPDEQALDQNSQNNGQRTSSSFTPAHAIDVYEDASGWTEAGRNQLKSRLAVKAESSARVMLSHIRGVARKGQVRVAPSVKRSVCKRCDILLIDGHSSTRRTENQSRGGRKPWTEVLVTTCRSCGSAKRYPIGAKRQPRRGDRPSKAEHRAIIGLPQLEAEP